MAEALLIIDFQNDFTPGGALAVPDGDRIAERVNELAALRVERDQDGGVGRSGCVQLCGFLRREEELAEPGSGGHGPIIETSPRRS